MSQVKIEDGLVYTPAGPRFRVASPHQDQVNLLTLRGKPLASIYNRRHGTQVSLQVGPQNLFNPLTYLAQKKGTSFKRPRDTARDTIEFLLTKMQKAYA